MAKINNIQIKNLKTFKGHEGEPLFQGNIYYKGKLLGFWSQDAHGGIYDNFNFNESVLDEEAKKYATSDRVEDEYRKYADICSLLNDLVVLMDEEKMYKSYVKNGYPATVVVTEGYNYFYCALKTTDKDIALKAAAKHIEECKAKCFKDREVKVYVYTSLDDFNINV